MSTIFTTPLRPGYLVHITTSIKGNVSYHKQDLEFLKLDDGASRTKWETERLIKDEEEQERASVVRSKCRSLIISICSDTDFGYLCPLNRAEDLEKAVTEGRRLVAEFNQTSKFTRIKFTCGRGYVADNDENAVKEINLELRGLIDEMKIGIENLDVDRIRDAASRATQMGQMLAPEAEVRIQLAVKEARDVATRMAKAVKAGSQAALEIDRATINRLKETRTAFLDIDQEDREIAQPESAGRAIDLEAEEGSVGAPSTPTRQLEVG